MKNSTLLLIVILITFFLIPAFAQNDETVLNLSMEGNAKIKKNEIAAAREEAIQDALEKAILEAISKILTVSIKDEKFQRAKSIIINEQDKYIRYYKIVEERKQSQNFIVNVNVEVALASLMNDLHKMGFLQAPKSEKSSINISLSVMGLKKYLEFSKLKEFLQNRPKLIKNIYPCSFIWGEAHYEIEISGDAQSFTSELMKNIPCEPNIKQINDNKIEMICLKKAE